MTRGWVLEGSNRLEIKANFAIDSSFNIDSKKNLKNTLYIVTHITANDSDLTLSILLGRPYRTKAAGPRPEV